MKRIALAFLLAVAGSTFASPIDTFLREVDHLAPGDRLVTLDTLTGRQWLDLSASRGVAYAELVAYGCHPTCMAGPFTGWTFAQSEDVAQLVQDAGLPFATNMEGDPAEFSRLALMVGGMLTDPFCTPICGEARGLLDRVLLDELPGAEGMIQTLAVVSASCCGDWGAADTLSQHTFGLAETYARPVGATESNALYGVWLFRVPEPGPLLLLGAAVVAALASSSMRWRARGARSEEKT